MEHSAPMLKPALEGDFFTLDNLHVGSPLEFDRGTYSRRIRAGNHGIWPFVRQALVC